MALWVLPTIYFTALVGPTAVVLIKFASLCSIASPIDRISLVAALALAIFSLWTTWGLIFSFFIDHVSSFGCSQNTLSLFTCTTESWLNAPTGNTFVEAYAKVRL